MFGEKQLSKKQSIDISIFSRMTFWRAIQEKKDVFTQEEIEDIIHWGREGTILISKIDLLKGIHYIKVNFYNEDKNEEEIYFAESQTHKGLYYLVKKNGNRYECKCQGYKFRHHCSHIQNLLN
jgi:lipopolysaccharide export LptBFGC system permease protein LptF